jgi:hypothetical protein
MRLLVFSILFLSHLLTSIAWAVPCEIKQLSDHFGNQRIAKIDFPDGRRITLVGQMHTQRSEMWEMLNLPDNENLFSEVRKRVNSSNSLRALPLFEEERKLLYDAVVKEEAKFIGAELSDEGVAEWLPKVREFQDRMLAHSARTGESDIGLISKARLAAYGPVLAMPLERPALFLKARLIGIEDSRAVKLQNEVYKSVRAAEADLLREIGNNKELIARFVQMDRDMQLEHYSHYDPKIPGINAIIINPLLSKWPGMYRKTVRKWLEAYVDFFATLFIRDELSTKNILAQNQSGIIFIGGAHVRPIMRRLRNACRENLQSSEDVTASISSPSRAVR